MRLSSYDKINLIAAYHFLVGGLWLMAAAAAVILPLAAVLLRESEFLAQVPGWLLGANLLIVGGLLAAIAGLFLVLGWGLWQLKPWARMGAMIVAIFSIPVVPIGTIAGGLILYVLLQDQTRELFVGPPPPPPPAPPPPRFQLAMLSDIHGNPIALEAVLADIEAQGGVDAYWVLGDLVALGHDPVGVLERLAELPLVYLVRGNSDRYVVSGDRPWPSAMEAPRDPGQLTDALHMEAGFYWTEGALAPDGWLDWLAQVPLEQQLTLPDGTRVLCVHAAPGTDDGDGIHPGLSESELRELTANCEADLVFVGHTHWPLDLQIDGLRLVNLGSVSNPLAPDLRASYTLLEADENGYRLIHRRVPYDEQAVIEAVRQSGHPTADYIISYFEGKQQRDWEQA